MPAVADASFRMSAVADASFRMSAVADAWGPLFGPEVSPEAVARAEVSPEAGMRGRSVGFGRYARTSRRMSAVADASFRMPAVADAWAPFLAPKCRRKQACGAEVSPEAGMRGRSVGFGRHANRSVAGSRHAGTKRRFRQLWTIPPGSTTWGKGGESGGLDRSGHPFRGYHSKLSVPSVSARRQIQRPRHPRP